MRVSVNTDKKLVETSAVPIRPSIEPTHCYIPNITLWSSFRSAEQDDLLDVVGIKGFIRKVYCSKQDWG